MNRPTGTTLATEFAGADLGDRRLRKRLIRIVEAAEPRPAESFPKIAADPSALEGLYRFLGNPRVTPEKMLSPHCRETASRALSDKKGWSGLFRALRALLEGQCKPGADWDVGTQDILQDRSRQTVVSRADTAKVR